jgi:hypothetical protein
MQTRRVKAVSSPTSHTLARLRKLGYQCEPVERFVARLNIRRDLWHFGDVLAVHPERREFLIVQATSADHVTHRLGKAKARPELAVWLRAGGRFEVHGWAKRGGRWTVRVAELRAEDLAAVVLEAPPRKRPRSRWRPGELFAGPEG